MADTAIAVREKENMLRLWQALADSPTRVTIVTNDHTAVSADSCLANGSQSLFAAAQLQTPLGTYPSAVLRARDVAQIDAKLSPSQLKELLADDPH